MAPQQVVIRLDQKHPGLRRIDPHTAFLYAPHTVSCLVLGLALLAYYSNVFSETRESRDAEHHVSNTVTNTAAGIWAAICVFLGYSVVQGPRTSMVRPHPAVWRLVHGMALVYIMGLVWLLFQTVDDARQFLKHLSPTLGVQVPSRDYGTACALTDPSQPLGIAWSNIWSTLFDEFVVAHTIGWWAKALLLRNHTLLWVYSIGFELMEYTFAHMLPNFKECWWDRWVLDVALCNWLGIHSGMATVRWLDMKYTNYNWQGLSELDTFSKKAKRSVAQLLPYSWTKLEWMVFSSPQRCLQSALVVAAYIAVELNVFFLKYALWIPPTDRLITARLVLWGLIGAPATREYYEYIQGTTDTEVVAMTGGRSFAKLGAFAWLAVAIIALETMISIKFGRGLYPQPWPRPVVATWTVTAAVAASLLVLWQLQRSKHQGLSHKPSVNGHTVHRRATVKKAL